MAVIAVAVAAAVFLSVQRVQLEQEFRSVETAVLYDEAAYLAGLRDQDTAETLRELGGYGVTSIFFKEPTLAELAAAGRLEVVSGNRLELDYPDLAGRLESLDRDLTYIVCDESTYQDIAPYLQARSEVQPLLGGGGERSYVLASKLPPSHLRDLGAGFSRQEIDQVNAAGLNVVLQVRLN